VNCEEARLLIGSDPRAIPEALAEHLRSCEACARFRGEMLALEDDLHRALSLPMPVRAERARPTARPAAPRPARTWHSARWALAATVLLGAGIALVLLILRPTDTLAAELVAHVEAEPESWSAAQPLRAPAVEPILSQAGVALAPGAGPVVYARTCHFRGRSVPHLVLRTALGSYTVLVLRGERVTQRRDFSEEGYSGVLLPASGGTLAVLGRAGLDTSAAADEVARSIRFLP
jgi:hypothetical protein